MGGMKKKPVGSTDKATNTATASPAGDTKTGKKEDLKKIGARPAAKTKIIGFRRRIPRYKIITGYEGDYDPKLCKSFWCKNFCC